MPCSVAVDELSVGAAGAVDVSEADDVGFEVRMARTTMPIVMSVSRTRPMSTSLMGSRRLLTGGS